MSELPILYYVVIGDDVETPCPAFELHQKLEAEEYAEAWGGLVLPVVDLKVEGECVVLPGPAETTVLAALAEDDAAAECCGAHPEADY